MEMVQHISGYVEATDLLTLRLTCKKLRDAALDAFAREYLEDLTCFAIDPDRLARVKNITSSSQLAAKVRTLTLTNDPFEEDYAYKMNERKQHRYGNREYPQRSGREIYPRLQQISFSTLNLALLMHILQKVHPQPCALFILLNRCYYYNK